MCFEFQGIIFNGEKVLKFSQMLMVRLGGVIVNINIMIFIHNILCPGVIVNINIDFHPQYQVQWRATGAPPATA